MSDNEHRLVVSRSKKHSLLVKRIAIITITVLLLAGVSYGIWYSIDLNNKSRIKTEQAEQLKKAEKSFSTYNDALKVVSSGDYTGGQAIIDNSIKNTSDKVEQAKLYLQKSSIAYNANKFDEAYDNAKKAEDLSPDVNSAKMMAAALAKNGDKTGAIKDYQLALSRITGTSELDELDKQDLRDAIKQLEG